MAKSSHTRKHIQLTKRELVDLDRFGCVFRAKAGVFYLDWRGRNVKRAANAEVSIKLGGFETASVGPLVFVAFEISPVRPLPWYCYFPFDLDNQEHQKFLARFAETGEITLFFLTGKTLLEHTIRITATRRERLARTYAEMLHKYQARENGTGDFDNAVEQFERTVRIPALMSRYLSERDGPELEKHIRESAQTVP